MKKSICYLSDDFSIQPLPPGTIISPEGLKNAAQINQWVKDLKFEPKTFATTSLYLLREFYIEGADVKYVNLKGKGEADETSEHVDDIGNIEILDRDLIQSERYLDLELFANNEKRKQI